MKTDSNVGHISTPNGTTANNRTSSKTIVFGAVTFGTSSEMGIAWANDRDSLIRILGSSAIFGGDKEALSSILSLFEA